MLTVFARVLFLACAAESEGQLPAALVAEEGVEESARRSEPALDESLVRLGGEILEAFGDDGGMAGRELSVLADPGIAETIPPTSVMSSQVKKRKNIQGADVGVVDLLTILDRVGEDCGVGASAHESLARVERGDELLTLEEVAHGPVPLQLRVQLALPLLGEAVAALLEEVAAVHGLDVGFAGGLAGERQLLVPIRNAFGASVEAKQQQ